MPKYREVAVAAAKEAGDMLLELAKRPVAYKMKTDRDIQAVADLNAERIILDKIHTAFPTHSILSEEAGEEDRSSEYLWVIDPLDGTINYVRGIDEYCVSIALSWNGEVILGVVYQPVRQQLFVAEKGGGAYLNDDPIHVNEEADLSNCLAATDTSADLNLRRRNFELLTGVAAEVRHVRIFGSGALHLIRIAQGQLDFYYKARYNHWDFAAGSLILQEAGGIATDLHGKPLAKDSDSIVAGSSAIHAKALQMLNRSV